MNDILFAIVGCKVWLTVFDNSRTPSIRLQQMRKPVFLLILLFLRKQLILQGCIFLRIAEGIVGLFYIIDVHDSTLFDERKTFGVLFDKELLTLQVLFCQVYRYKEAVLLRIEGKNKGMYSLILFFVKARWLTPSVVGKRKLLVGLLQSQFL